jgi:hypothetical protein
MISMIITSQIILIHKYLMIIVTYDLTICIILDLGSRDIMIHEYLMILLR